MKKTINIQISFTGVIDIKNIESGSTLQIKLNSTIEDVLTTLGIKREHKKYIITIVNDEKRKQSYVLQDNDHLSLFLPIGGG